jgi:hypothetical protein
MAHRRQRILVALGAISFAAFGLWLFVEPTGLASMGVVVDTANGRTEIRAFYGGLELGLAAYLGIAARRPQWTRPALIAAIFVLAGAGLGRVTSMAIEGQGSTALWILASAELGGALIGIWGLRAPSERDLA